MINYGLSQDEVRLIDSYIATCIDPDRDPKAPLPDPPAEGIGWLMFWTQMHLLRKTRPLPFWLVCFVAGVVLPVQLGALIVMRLIS